MGSQGSSCCQNVSLFVASGNDGERLRLNNEEDENGENTGLVSMADATGLEKKRGDARKGNKQRIGNMGDEATGEEHLAEHKKDKAMDKDTRELLKQGIKQDRVCAMLEDAEVEAILQSMQYFEFPKSALIIEEGKMGTTFFVTHKGNLEVSVNGNVCNTVTEGRAFGGLALLYNCPRTATVRAMEDCGIWGANGATFKKALQETAQKHQAENRKFLDSIRVFDGLNAKQKDRVSEASFSEVFEANARVVTAGDSQTAIYFVKKGELIVMKGGQVKSTGELVNGEEMSRLGPGECFGESMMMSDSPWDITVVSAGRSELLCISVKELKEALGGDLAAVLERNFVLQGLKKCPIISQFSSSQKLELVKSVALKDYQANAKVEAGIRFLIVVEGCVSGNSKGSQVTLQRGDWLEEGALLESDSDDKGGDQKAEIKDFVAGKNGARLGILTKEGLATALKELGLAAIGTAEEASDFTRKMVLAKKVHIFRHLSEEQTKKLVKSFVLQRYRKGAHVIKQGEVGSSFFVIANGEVTVAIDGKVVRTMTKNSYFGERALLFDEPRTATVEVSSPEAELWSIEKSTFSQIVKGNMQQELMNRIRLQDTNFGLKDLKQVKVIGAGAAGVVRLVKNKKTGMRYALKRVKKQNGKIPEEVQRECTLLKSMDHPFIMTMVQTYETAKSVYILTELITGGELHGAIREIPTVLSRAQAQFYTGSLVIVLEELSDRNIVYRDLKPENVMLDQQGYLKLIDFGIARKLEEGKSRTFTMIGTPHYMAPEVMRGHGYGTEVDLWSMGVMVFEFVCGYLPFADELDDPTEVCTAVLKDPLTFPARFKDVHGKTLIQGLLCRQPKKRLGAGINGWEDVKNADYFKQGHTGSSLFDKIMGRELDPPVVPRGETYCNPEDVEVQLSDNEELG